MAVNKTKTNGNGHVSLAREEYDAFQALDERCSLMTVENTKLRARNIDQAETLDAQVKHLAAFDMKVAHLERITSLQAAFIELLTTREKVSGLQDLSEFWKKWSVHTSNEVDGRRLTKEEVAKFEPDLFKSWRNWINDSGKIERGLSLAGSVEIKSQAMMQTHLLARKHAENVALAARVQKLEAELEAAKNTDAMSKAKP